MTSFAGVEVVPLDDVGGDYFRVLIHGPQGTGKTTLAASIAEVGPTLFIDLTGERGTRSLLGGFYSTNLQVIRPPSITALDDIYWALAKGGHPYRAVVIDSLTSVQKMAMRYLLGHDETAVREIKRGTAPADMRVWGQALDVMTDTATFWFGLADASRAQPLHVVMTAQTKVGEDGAGSTVRTPDVQKGALSITLAAPDFILYTDVEDNPDHLLDERVSPVRHVVRFGAHPEYRTKARLPRSLYGKIPSVLGRRASLDLPALGRVLGVGGIPAAAPSPSSSAAQAEASAAASPAAALTERTTDA
jgi:hypothetical protein